MKNSKSKSFRRFCLDFIVPSEEMKSMQTANGISSNRPLPGPPHVNVLDTPVLKDIHDEAERHPGETRIIKLYSESDSHRVSGKLITGKIDTRRSFT